MAASPLPPGTTAWLLTDGKAGDEVQCLAVAEALGLTLDSGHLEIRRVKPRLPFALAMPWGPIDPRDAPGRTGSPIAPPFPDLCIASGRRAVPFLRALKRASGGRSFTMFLKDPRTGAGAADLIWVPEHDRLRGPNVVVTLTPPHRASRARLAAARAAPDPRLDAVPRPRAAVLVGGDSRHHRFGRKDIARFVLHLEQLARSGAGLMITASRRTPERLLEALPSLAARSRGYYWDGAGDNPYIPMLALADAVVVTADSTNMVGEAAATGAPLLVFEPSGGHRKIGTFLARLRDHGAVKPFEGRLEAFVYEPIDSTDLIAGALASAYLASRP